MKKKIALICAVMLSVISAAQSVGAVNVILNSSYLKFPNQEPVVVEETVLVPVREVAEKMGLEVGWDDPSDTVTLKKDNFYIELVIGSTKVKTSSGEKTLTVPPQIINGRTMVPLRFIAEVLGLKVSWNEQYQRVVIVGQVDTTAIKPPTEEETGVSSSQSAGAEAGKAENNKEPAEEETEAIDEAAIITVEGQSTSVLFEIPQDFTAEDTESEESYAYRTLDAVDVQHKYNWENVSRCESYAAENGADGIVFVVQNLGEYTGETYDVSRINDPYPEKPENPVNMRDLIDKANDLIYERICQDRGVPVPENLDEMTEEEFIQYLGFTSPEEYIEFTSSYNPFEIMQELPEYAEYLEYQQRYGEYAVEVSARNAERDYAARMFSSVFSSLSDEAWATFFSSYFNSDPEVRYEGVEVININNHKIIHATVYAEDPDDEQGVYEYYHYPDGDCLITVFGGTLFGSEASAQAAEVLANMNIQ